MGPLGVPSNVPAQQRLLHYLLGGRLHPAVILSGPAGFERMTIAKNSAKVLLCKQPSAGQPFCGQCIACRKIDKEIHPDVLILKEENEEIIKIDRVREICSQMELTPIEGKARVCIVDECHRMNTAAANAFLKTLEEPGANRYFWLLTSQTGSLLPTILSRCLKFKLAAKADFEPALTQEQFDQLVGQLVRDKEVRTVIRELDSKEKSLDFVHRLQSSLRKSAIGETDQEALYRLLGRFEQTLQLEGRLRSNANYGLMLENFLSHSFLGSP